MLDITLNQAGNLKRLGTETVTFHLGDGVTLEILSADETPEQNGLVLRVPVSEADKLPRRIRIAPCAANLLVVDIIN